MLKSLIVTVALASLTAAGFTDLAQATSQGCALPMSAKSDCNRVATWPGPYQPHPQGE